ncbi:hypothetical protein [Chroococcidiopsis sp. CCMEE 29]|uniref:hypothetical protein n=1 Tax=Chroococcidiopsis sp. CCMEE 29 TaxID=155894 RepID=UPI0020227544|nr:hypothetical protein [Chroococcidiopsis sp. CCMEE 29]
MPKQYPLKIDTTFIETKPAGLAAKYLNSGEIQPRAGVEVAISCLFAPLGAAINGASRQEVEGLVAASRTQFEVFCALALNRCQENSYSNVRGVTTLPKTSIAVNAAEFNAEENIDFDSEELTDE